MVAWPTHNTIAARPVAPVLYTSQSVPKYYDTLYIKIQYKLSLYIGTERGTVV